MVRHMQRFARSLAFVGVMAVAVGCSGSTSVRPFGGTYDLATVDDAGVPQPLVPGTTTPELLAGTVRVGADSLDVTLTEQDIGSTGQPVDDPLQFVYSIPYARLGDSLYLPSDTLALHDSLYIGPPPPAIGAILGSSVRLVLLVAAASSTGFHDLARQFLFIPAR